MALESFEMRRIPKIDLHRHLDCSVRWSTFVELLRQNHQLKETDTSKLYQQLIVHERMTDLSTVLQKFLGLQKIFTSSQILKRIAFEVVEDAFNDSVSLLELRYAPTFIQEKHPELSFDEIHQALLSGINEAMLKFPIKVGLILIFQRIKDLQMNEKVAEFAIGHKDSLIAIDLADDESAAPALKFKKIFNQIHSRTSLPLTVHAGESFFLDSERSLSEAIFDLGARRIGHGVQVFRFPNLTKEILKSKIHLEICPISNYLTRSFPDWESHSLVHLYKMGVSLSINSDDPGMFGTTLTDDFLICQNRYGFKTEDFSQIFLMARQASFVKESSDAS